MFRNLMHPLGAELVFRPKWILFQQELSYYLKEFVGRPPLYFAERLTSGVQKFISSAKICYTGAHKINNSMGQILLAKRVAKSALSRKQEPDSMEWPPLRWRRCLGWSASSTWVKSIASDRRSTFSDENAGCGSAAVSAGQRTLKEAVNEAMRIG